MTDLSVESEEDPEEETLKKQVRQRETFNKEQVSHLEHIFGQNPYPNREIKTNLATKLSINERQLQVWFQNRRAKEKRYFPKIILKQKKPSMTFVNKLGNLFFDHHFAHYTEIYN